jgi:hypothetical protein
MTVPTTAPGSQPPAGKRKPYAAPRLISYGHVKDIVQGSTGNKADAGTTKQSGAPCWIADVLYGVDDPRTLVLRAWLTDIRARKDRGWPWVAMYIAVGRQVAALTRRATALRFVLRPLFDALAVQAFDNRARLIADERHRRQL